VRFTGAEHVEVTDVLLPNLPVDVTNDSVVLFGMTNTKTISVKIPFKLLRDIPAAGDGRSAFIIQALEEKIARRKPSQWQPKTERGKRMAALLRRGKTERLPLLSDPEIEQESAARRGRNF
jgi:hypothetical protein